MNRTLTLAVVAATLTCVVATGCEYRGASSLPLPGGEGKDGYRVTMVFDDVTNLVPQETCRANDVVVGSVESIELRDDLKATVVCRIDEDVTLAGNAVATLRETSLLGERFVALDPPAGEGPEGELEPGSTIDEARTHVVPNVEIVLGALSQVLNGSGLEKVDTISRELTAALSQSDLGGTTKELGRLIGLLADNRDGIVAALDSVDRLATSLNAQRGAIEAALEAVPEGLAALDRQRPRLVRTLTALGDLSDVAVPLIRDTKAATVADLELLAPILNDLADSKHLLARALEGIITFPFPSYTKYVTKGDYAGMFATIVLDIDSLNHLLGRSPVGADVPDLPTDEPAGTDPGLPGLPDLPELPIDELLDLLPDLQAPQALLNLPGGRQRVTGTTVSEPAVDLASLLTLGGTP
ncbi:MCE family protein [Nocardioides stalactiti]|uniref:MCE family protein n=1 Tax=Nocardioides stalactiti TaxID=2755356 RepID=UPI0015FEEFAB|nr:MCE family protein [Nocardioides stalactiti]